VVNSLHPGARLNTKMVREMFGQSWGSVQSGADVIIYVATSNKVEGMTGKYFNQMQEAQANAQVYDRQARQKLWKLSELLCRL